MAKLHFEHWYYQFTEDDLRYCSPNKPITETKSRLRSAVKQAIKKDGTPTPIWVDETLLLCANEAFPEAALADPLSDIRIWDDWRSGARVFPYPGTYARLSITQQLGKKNSTSSTGVLGEIIAGILGQVLIGPDVLVRVIGAWPDFIFSPKDNRYSFLEAKAFTPQAKSLLDDFFNIPRDEWGECLVNAVRHLTIDPFVKMWYSFTEIQEIQPTLSFSTKFFELDVPDARRASHSFSAPDELINGLAERAIQTGISYLLECGEFDFEAFTNKNTGVRRRTEANQNLANISRREIESVLSTINYPIMIDINMERLHNSILYQVENMKISESEADEEYLYSKISRYSIGKISQIREIGTQVLYKTEIPYNERESILNTWKPNFWKINSPHEKFNGYNLWRCGSFLFFLCDKGEDVDMILENLKMLK